MLQERQREVGKPLYTFRINDIDLTDVYGIVQFLDIHAYKSGRKRWTAKSILRFLDEIERDLSHDGTRVSLSCCLPHRRSLIIECVIGE